MIDPNVDNLYLNIPKIQTQMYVYQSLLMSLYDCLIESRSPCCHLIVDTLLALSLALKDNSLSCTLI